MRYLLLTFITILLRVTIVVPQTVISGSVLSTTGETLPGANVFVTGSYDGATTDTAGIFHFTTVEKGPQTLTILFLGCDTFRQAIVCSGMPVVVNARLKEQKSTLNEVVVTAGSFEAASDRRRAAVLSSIDIALTASASADIAGAITMLPGTTRNGESGRILVRGGAAYETRTFMDGLLIQNPYNSTVNNLPARNRFSPFLFKGTLFSTGGYSAEYGQAMSSALILNTEDLAPKTTTGLTLLSVGAGAAHTHRWKNTSLSASGSYSNLRPYFLLVPQKVDWIKAPQSGETEIIFRQKTSENGGMLKAYINYNQSVMKMNYPDDTQPQVTLPLQLSAGNLYTNVSYREMLGQNWLLFAGAALSRSRDDIASVFSNNKNHQSVQTRFSLSRSLNDVVKLKWGAEWYNSRYKETYRDNTTGPLSTRLKENYGAVFAETDLFLSPKWVARVGGRLEYSHLLNRQNLAPRLSVAYILRKNEQFSLATGRFFQTPEYDQMRYTSDLQFENATHLMANYQRIANGYIFRAEVYRKWYDNLIKNNPVTGLPTNTGQGYAQGLDLFFRDNHNIKNGDYWISYSYLDTRRDWRDFPVTATPNFAMKHSVSLVFKKFFPKYNTAFSASYAFNSGRPFYDPNLPADRFNSSRTPAYHDLSIAVTYLTNIAGHFTIFYMSVQNVPGFTQTFGYQYGNQPNNEGYYSPRAIQPPAKRFGVIAVIMSIGQQYNKAKVTSDDY